jgi:2-phospho-L-lactate/phosphoenolpyruvate guanylyltransferase
MTPTTDSAWVVVVPVKHGDIAKSRLTGVTARQRTELARAFPADCASAALACDLVGTVVVVTDDTVAAATMRGVGATVIADEPDAGLNPALQHARAWVRRRIGDVPVVVLSGDLPALRPGDLSTALTRAQRCTRAFLPDLAGGGTTLLAAQPDVDLDPRFGTTSRRRHRDSGACELDAEGLATLRRDVDTWDDLEEAVRLGVGPHTAAVLRRHRLIPVARG